MYTVKDLDTGEVIQGKFYTQELQKVANVFRIEKVLRTKKQGKKLMYYVKWMGYTTPSWISSEALVI